MIGLQREMIGLLYEWILYEWILYEKYFCSFSLRNSPLTLGLEKQDIWISREVVFHYLRWGTLLFWLVPPFFSLDDEFVFLIDCPSSFTNPYFLDGLGYNLLYMKAISDHRSLDEVGSNNPIHAARKIESYFFYSKPCVKWNLTQCLGYYFILGTLNYGSEWSILSFSFFVRDYHVAFSFGKSYFINTHSSLEMLGVCQGVRINLGFPLSKIWKDFFVLFFKGLWMKVIVFGSELIASGCLSMYLF